MDLRLRVRQVGGATVVEVGGEVELHSAPQLREELHRACEAENPCIIVDLSAVSFIDSTGLGVLIGGLKRARERGSLSLVCPQQKIKRVFEITGLTSVFTIWNSADEAIASCAPKDRAAVINSPPGTSAATPSPLVPTATIQGRTDG